MSFIRLKHFMIYIGSICLIFVLFGCNPKSQLPDPLEAGWKGEKVCEVLKENDSIRVLKCTFAPGVGHERHEHAPHFGYTLKGSTFRITDDTGSREVNVPEGYDFYKDEVSIHEVVNIGDSTAVFLIIEPK
jgi:quercetin dioxygenase-like cupin family protein